MDQNKVYHILNPLNFISKLANKNKPDEVRVVSVPNTSFLSWTELGVL